MTDGGPVRWLLAIGLPAAVAALWAVLVAPESTVKVSDAASLILGLLILGACAGRPRLRIDLWRPERAECCAYGGMGAVAQL